MADSNGTETGRKVPTPRGLGAAGRRLWDAGMELEWAAHEIAMLEEACRCRDVIVALDKDIAERGHVLESPQGVRLNPAVAEARQQRLALARLLATLGIPPLEEDADALPRSRGVRGVYSLGGDR